ncbi:Transmembrane protein 33, partial [Schistosoma japonicum]
CLSYLVALWFNQTSISFKCQSLHIGKAILARFLLCTGKFAMSTVNGSSGDVRQRNSFISHLKSNYVNTAMYFARLGTLFCCIMFFFAPLFSHLHPSDLEVWYRRALLASAATSALRLHQRIKSLNTGFSREVLEVLITEDSSHYLLFSIMFAILPPVTVSLVPIFLFALLHVASFTNGLLNNNGATRDGSDVLTPTSNSSFLHQTLQKLVNSVKAHDQNILRIIALNEIMLMVVCIFMALSGPRIFVLPFIYYPFLKMRYNSKRNPYTRNAFMEVRIALQNVAYHSKCPAFISRVIYGLINIVSRLGTNNYARN